MDTSNRHHVVVIGFMTAVTGWLLVLLFAAAGRGSSAAGELLVYGLTAGFGLEFISSSWPSVWGRRD
jgi:hypothetical protein